jgi:glycosyltransferase involved in cell wall biosynthesis
MNIWLLHPYAGGPDLGRHWRPFWLADAWIRMGHRPIVICANFHHLVTGKIRPPGPQRIGDVDFWFVKTPRYNNNSFGRLRNNVSFGFQFSRDAVAISEQFGKPDLIIASTPHLFYVSAARRIARQFKAKFWIEVRDLWPKSIVALGLAPAWHPLVKLIGWQESYAYRAADRVISLLGGAEAHMNSRGLPFGRFVWVPNGVSETEIRSALEPQELDHGVIQRIDQMKTQGKRIVLYAGAMGPPNAMEVVIDAAALLGKTNPEIHFVLIGSGIGREQLQQRAINLPNVEFEDEVERPIVHAILRASDCAVMSFHKNPLYDHGISPNKLFDYCLFAPRSVIACDPMALIGFEDLVTLRCMPDNPAMLAHALSLALSSPGRPLDQRVSVIEQFSYSRLAARYLA